MTDDRRDHPGYVQVALGLGDAFGEAADRDAGVGGEALGPGAQRAGGVVGAVAGAPEASSLALVRRPLEVLAAVAAGDRAYVVRLRLDLSRRPVELEEERGR